MKACSQEKPTYGISEHKYNPKAKLVIDCYTCPHYRSFIKPKDKDMLFCAYEGKLVYLHIAPCSNRKKKVVGESPAMKEDGYRTPFDETGTS